MFTNTHRKYTIICIRNFNEIDISFGCETLVICHLFRIAIAIIRIKQSHDCDPAVCDVWLFTN